MNDWAVTRTSSHVQVASLPSDGNGGNLAGWPWPLAIALQPAGLIGHCLVARGPVPRATRLISDGAAPTCSLMDL
jgi:hypothetical protein